RFLYKLGEGALHALIIDSRFRRAFTGPPRHLPWHRHSVGTKRNHEAHNPYAIFPSGRHGYTGARLLSSQGGLDNGGPSETYQDGTFRAHRSRLQRPNMDILVADDDCS